MKLRTGQSNEFIGKHFNLTKVTIGKILCSVRKSVNSDFLPLFLRHRTRKEMINSKTVISNKLFKANQLVDVESIDEPPYEPTVLVWDSTYVFVEQSKNINFQKQTYSDQKKRNFVRVMICVSPDGYIEHIYGPYATTMNDAKIMRSILCHEKDANKGFKPGDFWVLDRGFRDVVDELSLRGINARMPSFLNTKGKNGKTDNSVVFTMKEANRSRYVTKVRFVVEVRNAHFKNIWKIFHNEWNVFNITHMMNDFKIAAALLNRYFPLIISDKEDGSEIADRMIAKLDEPNILEKIVKNPKLQHEIKSFGRFENSSFPILSTDDLKLIVLGTYQLELAPSYYAAQCTH